MPQFPKSSTRITAITGGRHTCPLGPTGPPAPLSRQATMPALASDAATPDAPDHGRYAMSESRAKQPQASGHRA